MHELTDEQKRMLEEIIGRCECPPLKIELIPIRTKEDVFKDYSEQWNNLPLWKQEEMLRNINVQAD